MGISQKDIKLLWGRAASRCAFPKCKVTLTQGDGPSSPNITIGEQAHIVAKEPNGPRGQSLLTESERDSYANLILLCPTHHTLIDKAPDKHPIEKLHLIKSEHELWVQEKLSTAWDSKRQAEDAICTSILDAATTQCHLSSWKTWTSGPLMPIPSWHPDFPDDFLQFRQTVLCADFPDSLPEFKAAAQALSVLLHASARCFQQHCKTENFSDGSRRLVGVEFNKISEWDPEKYHKLRVEFDNWVEECHGLVIESTKAANWFRDVVRRDINPLFFAAEGKFMATYPFSADLGLSTTYLKAEYLEEEKSSLPQSLTEKLQAKEWY